jgi:hypothetical protein
VIGVGDGSGQGGRAWRFQGYGNVIQVPGTTAGDVSGLGALPVDMKPNYQYDMMFVGFTSGTGGQYKATILGSHDGGATYPIVLEQGPESADAASTVSGKHYITRTVNVNVASNVVIDHVKVQWQRAVPADAALTYDPANCSLVIQEWSYT